MTAPTRPEACSAKHHEGYVCGLPAAHLGHLHFDTDDKVAWGTPRQFAPCGEPTKNGPCWLARGHVEEHRPLLLVEALLPLSIAFGHVHHIEDSPS